ncbi:MAG TPA: ZIP family metal transporter [Thermoplasmata archaeon]|nr:ZIP family metal transporter [Thermoplasmata archaeon]
MTDVLYAGFLGLIAGLVPVYIGLAPLWIFKRLSVGWRTALVSFSAGILLFLFAEVTHEGVELSAAAGSTPALFVLGLGLGLLGPVAITHIRRRKMASQTPAPPSDTPSKPIVSAKLFTAQMIALGIGLHNLGEGLAIGAAYAAGVFGLTNLLVIGFALHNSTEGLGISGPIASTNRGARDPLLLGFLAGSPTILGSMIGSLAYSPALGTLFFSAAAGALLYVIVELVKVTSTPESSKLVFVGIVIGMVLMFGTGLLVR